MAHEKAYIGVDLGAESVRIVVGVLDGGGDDKKLTLHEAHRFRHESRQTDHGLFWDWTLIWNNILEGCRRAVEWVNEKDIPLVSLGVDAWGVDCAFLDDEGKLIQPPRCYRDPANVPAQEVMLEKLGPAWLYERTGIQFMPINTLPQLCAQKKWDEKILQQARTMLFIPDLLHHMFTGSKVVEHTIASTSQMLDPRTGKWATDVLEKLGLSTGFLPKIVQPGAVIGELLPRVAHDIGSDPGLRVITPAGHDTASAVISVPADSATDWCYLSSGTWSLIGAELTAPCTTDAAREVPFTNEGGLNGTTRFLKNIAGLWLVQEIRRAFEKRGVDEGGEAESISYESLTKSAEAAEPFRTLLNPSYQPFLEPGDMPAKIAAFARKTGQPEPESVGQFVRCCLESLALEYRRVLENLEQVLGRKYQVLHIVGGGGKNKLLNRMAASATGCRVVVGPEEATVTGNVLVQAMGAGHVKDLQEIRRVVARSFKTHVCEPEDRTAWSQAYERYLKLCGR